MKLSVGFGELDFGKWAYGLADAFIGGGAGAFSSGIASILVDPRDFNIWTGRFWALVCTSFVVSGLGSFFSYLHSHPLPTMKQVTTTIQTTETAKKAPVVVTTVEEVHTEKVQKGD